MNRLFWGLILSVLFHGALFVVGGLGWQAHTQAGSAGSFMEPQISITFGPVPPEKVVQINEKRGAPQVAAEGDWVEPNARSNPLPPYPHAALMRNIEGVVTLIVWVDAEGHAERVDVEKTSGSNLLDQSAVETVRKWEFVPATLLGHAVRSRSRIPIRFQIKPGGVEND